MDSIQWDDHDTNMNLVLHTNARIKKKSCSGRESNPRPRDYETHALPDCATEAFARGAALLTVIYRDVPMILMFTTIQLKESRLYCGRCTNSIFLCHDTFCGSNHNNCDCFFHLHHGTYCIQSQLITLCRLGNRHFAQHPVVDVLGVTRGRLCQHA